MRKVQMIVPLVMILALVIGCEDDESTNQPQTGMLTLNLTGLENLGSDYAYEGWILVGGSPVSTGVFTVDDNGDLSASTFELPLTDLQAATKFILTIEPSPDSDPSPASTHYLAGDFSQGNASLSVGDAAALGDDFTASTGTYILATPTNNPSSDENSGIWFLDLSSGNPAQGLFLPTLPDGWKYEGWAVIDGTPVTTGTFLSATVGDDSAPYSGPENGPEFPGEDFLVNAPAGLTFPTDLAGGAAVISIEPDPDNSAAPFALKPLVGNIPPDATDHMTYEMGNNASAFPAGTASW
ncbi:MAG: anti-sigma factor [Candidatus Zixiibacteriota bacterium]|nr:MAG: anti-sigma factor [candidate division Zixibacteria bacterium]